MLRQLDLLTQTDSLRGAQLQTASKEIRELKRKVSELERTIEILTAATSFFAREHDPLRR